MDEIMLLSNCSVAPLVTIPPVLPLANLLPYSLRQEQPPVSKQMKAASFEECSLVSPFPNSGASG